MSNRMKKSDYNKLFENLKDFVDELDFKLKQKPKIKEIQALVGIIQNELVGALEKTHTDEKLSKEERKQARENEFKNSPIYSDFLAFAEKWRGLGMYVETEFCKKSAGGKVSVYDCFDYDDNGNKIINVEKATPLFSRTFLVTPRKPREKKAHAKGTRKVKKVKSKE